MLEFIRSLFMSSPGKKILKERDGLYEKAVNLQRNGDLRGYAEVMARIEKLEEEYSRLRSENE